MKSTPIDPVAAAEFIIRRLVRRLHFSNADYLAIAETEHPFGDDDWYWTDDNAKVLEFLARPELAGGYREQATEILRFLQVMFRGPLILRRVSTPRLLETGRRGTETSYYHSLMHLRCDLTRGVVMVGIRFHDARDADNLLLYTNCVEFTYRKQKYVVLVEEAIDSSGAELGEHHLELRYSAELFFTPRRKKLRVGRITYVFTIDSCSMAINVEATLDVDSAAEITDAVLTVGHDYLSHGLNGVAYHRVFVNRPGAEEPGFAAGEPGRHFLAAAGADYYSIAQTEIAGFALAVHSRPREPARLREIEVLVREPGKLHLVRSRYRFDGDCRGRRLVIAEDKMLTAGGFYGRVAEYSGLLHDAVALRSARAPTVVDFSVSYDYGAELNAFAQYFVALSRDGAALSERAPVKALFDTYLQYYFDLFVEGHYRRENTIFSRQLAFVMLGLATMVRATGGTTYRARLQQLCDVMLEFEKPFDDVAGQAVSGFMMGTQSSRIVFVDCHSAALLALIEAASHVADPRLAASVDRGLGCFSIQTTKIDWIDEQRKIDVVAVDWVDDEGTRHSNHGFWTYHTGLTLRMLAALRRSPDRGMQAVEARHRDRLGLIETLMRWHVERSLTWHDGAVEIRSSILSTETNSETQPWAAIGLLDGIAANSAA